jgi:hypothetical protein
MHAAGAARPIPFGSGVDAPGRPRLARRRHDGHALEVSLPQLRYFIAVAEEGNVGRAAQRLRVAQPPLSRQIRTLEDELGTRLFERTPRGMTLLPPGRVFLDHARAILAAVDRAVDATRAEKDLPPPASSPTPSRPPRA